MVPVSLALSMVATARIPHFKGYAPKARARDPEEADAEGAPAPTNPSSAVQHFCPFPHCVRCQARDVDWGTPRELLLHVGSIHISCGQHPPRLTAMDSADLCPQGVLSLHTAREKRTISSEAPFTPTQGRQSFCQTVGQAPLENLGGKAA